MEENEEKKEEKIEEKKEEKIEEKEEKNEEKKEEKNKENTGTDVFKQWWFYVIIGLAILVVVLIVILLSGKKDVKPEQQMPPISNTEEMVGNNDAVNYGAAEVGKIQIEKAGIAKNGDFVIKVTNNNSVPVCISDISVDFKNQNGEFEENKTSTTMYFGIPAGGTTYAYISDFDNIDLSKYPKFEFNCKLAGEYVTSDQVFSGVEVKANNVNKKLAVTLKNNSGKAIRNINLIAVYFKNNEIVGVEEGYVYNKTVKNGSEGYTNIEYPTDRQYNEVAFDKYEVYFLNGEITTEENDSTPAQTQETVPAPVQEETTPAKQEEVQPEKQEEKPTSESTKKDSSSTGIRPDFKKAMDSYEEFIDGYVEILKKYNKNPSDMTILSEYTTYMGKYSQFEKDFENWKTDDLNSEELAYYTQVQSRVLQKLTEAK